MELHLRTTPVLRVFISSPGDVADERGLARTVLDELPRDDRGLRGRVVFEPVAWDQGRAPAPMLADRTPQASVNAASPRPSECDIVVVILWGRIGTPIPAEAFHRPDGSAFASGTEWEFHDALEAARRTGSPLVLVYRRTSPVSHDLRARDLQDRLRQLALVDAFFDRLTDQDTRAILQGVNQYETPDEFRRMLHEHLAELALRLIGPPEGTTPATPTGTTRAAARGVELWVGSPFPGLRSFTTVDAPIFFGRGPETDTLVSRVGTHSFVAVVGASGSGKSSLVGAGLIPRLAAGAIPGSEGWLLPQYEPRMRQWMRLHLTPGDLGGDPFLAMANKLAPWLEERVRDVAARLLHEPAAVVGDVECALAGHGADAAALVVIDQLEELFTVTAQPQRDGFAVALEALTTSGRARVVVTLRADFYGRALETPALARLLTQGHLPLAAPSDGLVEMITRPAERAGLEFDEGLPGRILTDAGSEPGALPLLAYALDELYRSRTDRGRLTTRDYETLGGVHGAIGARAGDVFEHRLDDSARESFSRVFTALVDVDDERHVTRRRVALTRAAGDEAARRLVDVLTEARLLERTSGVDAEPVVYVAHEALFSSWDHLRAWIASAQADLRLLHRLRVASREWDENGRGPAYLWPQERLDAVDAAVLRLGPDLDLVTRAFIRPEHERLFPVLRDAATEEYRRQSIADRLVQLGPSTLPGLLEAVTDPVPGVRTVAAAALGRMGHSAVPGLVRHLANRDPEVRLAAVAALRHIADPSAVEPMMKLLRDVDRRVRSMAAGALESVGGDIGARAGAKAAARGDLDDRWHAVGLLGTLGTAGVSDLLDLMADASPPVRDLARRAVQALGLDAVPPLIAALDGPQGRQHEITLALADLGPRALPLLLDAAAANPDVRPVARTVMVSMGPPAVPSLLDAAARERGDRLALLAGALVDIGTPAALLGVVERGLLTIDSLLDATTSTQISGSPNAR